MSASKSHHLLRQIVSNFEALAKRLEQGIEVFIHDGGEAVDLGALQRAKDAARHGAKLARSASSDVR